jgi:CRP/FNR family transcriptional regulator, anaerobic regulatory protein
VLAETPGHARYRHASRSEKRRARFGEHTRNAEAVTFGSTQLQVEDGEIEFRLAAQKSKLPSLAFDVTWLAAREEQLIDEHLLSLGRRTALERAAYLLLHLFARAEEAGLVKNGNIQFPFTQQHLADTLGMSLVHTNKTLKRLFVTKAVRWKDRLFEIADRAALASIAGSEVPRHRPRPFI